MSVPHKCGLLVASARYAMRYPDDKQAIEPMPRRAYWFDTTNIGLPDEVGRLVKAAAQTMQRANSIGPGDRWLDSAMLFCERTATARLTCSAS